MPAARDMPPPRRILIIKPSSLGDIVHALPLLAGLRARYPHAHIAWLVAAPFRSLLEGHPVLDETIVFDRRHYGRMLRNLASLVDFGRFVLELRRRRFDLVIDLQGLFRSGFLALASGARERVGLADVRELASVFYTRRVAGRRRDLHAVALNLKVGHALGLPVDPPQFPLGLRDADMASARARLAAANLADSASFVAVVIGARWESKQWPTAHWANLLARFDAAGRRCVLLGGPDERETAAAILNRMQTASATTGNPVTPLPSREGLGEGRAFAANTPLSQPLPSGERGLPLASSVINLVGQTSLRELTALLALAELVVCQDSGPMHIAAALNKPLVALFGPTNPARTGPFCSTARVVQRQLPCVPCYRRICPLQHHDCLRGLTAAAVWSQVPSSRQNAAQLAHNFTPSEPSARL